MEIYLIRHPEVNIDPGICYGWSDVGVSDDLLKFAVAKVLRNIPGNSGFNFYCSDLIRCRVLAEKISSGNIYYSSAIRELNFGNWEMKLWNEIPQDELNFWMEDFVNRNCSGGESYKELCDRVINFWNSLVKKDDDKIAVITHGGVIRSILCHALDIPLKNAFKLKIDYAGISKVTITNNNELVEFINK